MINLIEEIGRNAGKLWSILNAHGQLTDAKLMNTTMMNENALYAAIGWLARENKIHKNVLGYRLGETNLASKIGDDAGKIMTVLTNQHEIDISTFKQLAQTTQLEERDVYAALGWLAREDKIEAKNLIKPK
jgi:hypothetical protein